MEKLKLIAVAPGEHIGIAAGSWGAMVSGAVAPRKGGSPVDLLTLQRLDDLLGALPHAKVLVTVPRRGATRARRNEHRRMNDLVRGWAEKNNVECTDVATPDVKKRFTGNGNASDNMLVAECVRRGFEPADHLAALAIAAFHVGLTGNYGSDDFLSPIGAG